MCVERHLATSLPSSTSRALYENEPNELERRDGLGKTAGDTQQQQQQASAAEQGAALVGLDVCEHIFERLMCAGMCSADTGTGAGASSSTSTSG